MPAKSKLKPAPAPPPEPPSARESWKALGEAHKDLKSVDEYRMRLLMHEQVMATRAYTRSLRAWKAAM